MIYKVWDIEHKKALGSYRAEKYANQHRDRLNALGMTVCVVEEDGAEKRRAEARKAAERLARAVAYKKAILRAE